METIEEGDNPQVKFKFGMMVEITEPGLVDTGERGVVTHVSSGMYACTVAFESGTSAVLYWRWLTPVADDTPAPDLAAQLAEARRELAAANERIAMLTSALEKIRELAAHVPTTRPEASIFAVYNTAIDALKAGKP